MLGGENEKIPRSLSVSEFSEQGVQRRKKRTYNRGDLIYIDLIGHGVFIFYLSRIGRGACYKKAREFWCGDSLFEVCTSHEEGFHKD